MILGLAFVASLGPATGVVAQTEAKPSAEAKPSPEAKPPADIKPPPDVKTPVEVKPQVVASGLNVPLGVSVDPESGEAIVAESGAARLVRVDSAGKISPLITGFPISDCGPDKKLRAGPGTLAYVDKQTLAVLDLGTPEGTDALRLYAVPAAGQPPIGYPDVKQSFRPLGPRGDGYSASRLGGICATPNVIISASHSDEPQAWLARSVKSGDRWAEPTRFAATRETTGVERPTALAFSPRGEVVVGSLGTWDKPKDSRLSFLHIQSGRVLTSHSAELHDLVALAYSPKTNQLYALDLAWANAQEGGLFQLVSVLVDGRPALAARRVVPLERPTALVFHGDGTLLVTQLGPAGGAANAGQLLRFAPGL